MRRAREVTRVRDGGPRLYGVYRAYANLDPGLDKVSLRSTRACSLWFTYASELVARNAEDAEVPERGLECIQRVVLGRGDSEGRHVDEQDDPAVVRRPVERLPAVHVQDLVVVDRAIAGQRVVAQRLATHHNRFFSEPQIPPHNQLFSEPPTFGGMQHTFSQMKKFSILQGSVITFFRCGG